MVGEGGPAVYESEKLVGVSLCWFGVGGGVRGDQLCMNELYESDKLVGVSPCGLGGRGTSCV